MGSRERGAEKALRMANCGLRIADGKKGRGSWPCPGSCVVGEGPRALPPIVPAPPRAGTGPRPYEKPITDARSGEGKREWKEGISNIQRMDKRPSAAGFSLPSRRARREIVFAEPIFLW